MTHFRDISADQLRKVAQRFTLITDKTVENLYAKALAETLSSQGLDVMLISIPPGEASKTRETKQHIEDKMFKAGLGRDSGIIGMGGGVITDIAGFVASTYCRGVPLVLIPTTLMAMVDASIGGKTGVNAPEGKNLIGSFYPPHLTLMDVGVLQTLPQKEVLCGLAEVIKYGLIGMPQILQALESETIPLKELIAWCCALKKSIVSKDPHEKGLRRILNFGHTIAHAIETASHYRISHGEAVAVGLAVESRLSAEQGLLPMSDVEQLVSLLKKRGFSLKTNLSFASFAPFLKSDKKAQNGAARFVLLEKMGKVAPFNGQFCTPLDDQLVEHAWEWMQHV